MFRINDYPFIVERDENNNWIEYFHKSGQIYKRIRDERPSMNDYYDHEVDDVSILSDDECITFINNNMEHFSLVDMDIITSIKRDLCIKMMI
jgi:hypothetical protein